MTPNPKPRTYENPDYLKFIRSKGCLVCRRKAEAHHVRRHYWGAGTGKKPHDYVAIPLCHEHHDPKTEFYFERIECQIIELLMDYIESKRGRRSR